MFVLTQFSMVFSVVLRAAAGRDVRPAAHLLFFVSPPERRPKKRRQKKGDPTGRVPALRSGQPPVLDQWVVLRNSLCSLRSRRSNNRSKSVHEARAYCIALAHPLLCAPQHVQRGWEPDSGHCFARPLDCLRSSLWADLLSFPFLLCQGRAVESSPSTSPEHTKPRRML